MKESLLVVITGNNLMKIKRLIIFCTFIFISRIAFATNGEEFDISKIPLNQCTFEKSDSTLIMMSSKRASNIAENSTATLNEVQYIVDHAKKPHQPNVKIGDFLSPDELDKFSEASQRVGVLNMETLIEGDFDRDLNAVYRLVQLAGDYYRDNKIPSESDKDDYLLFGFLASGVMPHAV